MEGKIALCFLTYNNLSKPQLWEKFINTKYNIYIHNKNKFSGVFEKFCIKNKIETKWGDISLVKATLNLFKEACEVKENKYFILLSDKCIPLYNSDELYEKITKMNNNIISCYSPKKNGYFSFPNWNIRQCKYRFNLLNDKSFFDINNFKKQHQWMILNRETVDFFLNNNYLDIFGNNFSIIDEHYFINIIIKFDISFINKSITFIDRKNSSNKGYKGSPKIYNTLTNEIIEDILKSDTLFIRKITPECNLPSYFDKFY
jgi:hypothetical protein